MSKKVMIRDVAIGDGNPIAIQSMSNADSRNEKKITEQIRALEEAGCDIIRLAVPDREISGPRLIYLWLQIFILIIDLQSGLLRQGQTKYELTREI